MNIISSQTFRNADPIDRKHFILRYFGTMTNAASKFKPTLGAFSRAINNDANMANFLNRISESKTMQNCYKLEKQRLLKEQASSSESTLTQGSTQTEQYEQVGPGLTSIPESV